jgi:NTE family protein
MKRTFTPHDPDHNIASLLRTFEPRRADARDSRRIGMGNACRMARVGLVLGGGGLVGQAYHAGVLAALEHDLGWDPRDADTIVGTSAGSLTGVLLRSGVPASELAAWLVEAEVSARTRAMFASLDREIVFDPLEWRSFLRPGLPSVGLLHGLLVPPRSRVVTAALTLLRAERVVVDELAFLDAVTDGTWPDAPFLVCTVRRTDGRRVVFGLERDEPRPSTQLATAASCAVPGYFAPVTIAGVDYIDGGAHSITNADVLATSGRTFDVVIVVSPMSCAGRTPLTLGGTVRRLARRALRNELATLEAVAERIVVFEPGPSALDAMGDDVMNRRVLADVVREAFLETAGQLDSCADARRLLDLRSVAAA